MRLGSVEAWAGGADVDAGAGAAAAAAAGIGGGTGHCAAGAALAAPETALDVIGIGGGAAVCPPTTGILATTRGGFGGSIFIGCSSRETRVSFELPLALGV